MINADYATFFSNLPLEKINLLEVHLLRLFNFSVEITREEYEKMNKTIQDLNNAATIMHLRMVTPLLSPHVAESGGVSISGRIAFHHSDIVRNLEEEQESDRNESLMEQMDEYSAADEDPADQVTPNSHFFSSGKSSPNHTFTGRSSTKSLYQSTSGSHDLEEMALSSPFLTYEKFESIPEDLFEERPVTLTRPKRRTSVQIAVDNALSVLIKYFPRSSSKVHVTNETGSP
jgi:hypothetical protein